MSAIWNGLLDVIAGLLEFFQGVVAPVLGEAPAWGWAIILLTVAVRVLLLPLAIKQTRSQRAMQRLAPEIKKIQAKYKADRSLMRTDPEKYRELRQKQQEATMSLYKEHGVNPAAGCLPLVAQMPVFFALFTVLRTAVPPVASFYFVEALDAAPGAQPDLLSQIGGFLLVALMAATTFYSSRQMMATSAAAPEQAQQQRLMMYIMPVILVPISLSLPVGVLLYWVTTNVWTIGQQFVIFRNAPASALAQGAKSG